MIKKLDVSNIIDLEELGKEANISREYFLNDLNNPFNYTWGYYQERLEAYLSFFDLGDQIQIGMIYVRKSKRKSGLAMALFDKLFNTYLDSDINNFNLEVRKSNESALKLYNKLGFKSVATRFNYYQDPVEDGVLMIKERK